MLVARITTPSALSKEASPHFIDAQPPLLFQEGTTAVHGLRNPSSSTPGLWFTPSNVLLQPPGYCLRRYLFPNLRLLDDVY
jgi:hypothetical protein